jgi:hypothetical protein
MSDTQFSLKVTWLLMLLSLAAGIFSSILFTELGQLLNMPSEWLYGLYPHLGWTSAIVIAIVLYVLFQHFHHKIMSRRIVIGYVVLVVGMVFVTNFFVPNVWLRGHHHTAMFIPVSEADTLLESNADVFVLEINGEARAYPRDWMMLPHIAGDTVGGEEVAMTYCALSNLPLAFSSNIEGKEANLKVVSQVHNNLVMVDNNSGELYQQITASTPDNRKTLAPQAALRMPWRSFKKLYPEGKVFHVVESGPYALLDKITYALFVSGLEPHYNGPDPLFPTLRLDDNRLPAKEQIWGINIGDEQVAYALSFLQKQPVHNITIGGKPVVVAWFPEYETLGVFSRIINGEIIEVNKINVHGNTGNGKLKRLPQYPHVFWMVWSHWYPQTKVMI